MILDLKEKRILNEDALFFLCYDFVSWSKVFRKILRQTVGMFGWPCQ